MIKHVIGNCVSMSDLEINRDGKNIFIPHICNSTGGWGSGFVVAISNVWSEPESSYRQWFKDKVWGNTPFMLGEVQFIKVEPHIMICNMIGQHATGNNRFKVGDKTYTLPPIRYSSLISCMLYVAQEAHLHNANIHCPKFGSGLAGGNWSIIEGYIQKIWVDFAGLKVFVYTPKNS